MLLRTQMPVGRKGGRPRLRDEDGSTKMVRVNGDLAEMISWIVRLEDLTSARLLDPIIRPSIVTRFARIAAAVEKIKKAEDATRKIEEAARETLDGAK